MDKKSIRKTACQDILHTLDEEVLYVLRTNYPATKELGYEHGYSILCKQLSQETELNDNLLIDLAVSAFLYTKR